MARIYNGALILAIFVVPLGLFDVPGVSMELGRLILFISLMVAGLGFTAAVFHRRKSI